eukprot:TRINITY_DN5739_c0_g1_i1.p1 TRINITY_DN5739_c0_g1~~TRINITY_DN5739_c0_g1_i1.p1  ORF type:complete len:734 (-),score=247.62 TRINITY_DN5739_c0_g1_i1:1383-3584(-)
MTDNQPQQTEKKTVDSTLLQHHDQFVRLKRLSMVKKKETIPCIVVFGRHRIVIVRSSDGKLLRDFHAWDIVDYQSDSHFFTFKFKDKSDNCELQHGSDGDELSECLIQMYSSLPDKNRNFTLLFPKIERKVEGVAYSSSDSEPEPCGGFVFLYLAFCDFYQVEPCNDICWDMNNMYPETGCETFNLVDLFFRSKRLTIGDLRCLFETLQYNNYFTTYYSSNLKYEKEVLAMITQTLTINKHLQSIVMSDVGIKHEQMIALSTSLSLNQGLALRSIDLSKNPLENKGLIAFSSLLGSSIQRLESLNLSGCGGTSTGLAPIIKGLEKYQHSLTFLDLSHNKIEDASKGLASLFSVCSNLQTLKLKECSLDFHLLNKCETATNLDVSDNRIPVKDNKYLDAFRFFQSSTNLTQLNVSKTGMTADILEAFIQTIPNVTHLDLSDNSMGDNLLFVISSSFTAAPNRITTLILDRNFEKPSKQRQKVVNDFAEFLEGDHCLLEELQIAGGPKSQLKADCIPIIFALMKNVTLKTLDVTGNASGDSLPLALSKALQLNTTLTTIKLDDNGIGPHGFYALKRTLTRNSTLCFIPTPTIDISVAYKDKPAEVVKDISTLLAKNCIQSLSVSPPPYKALSNASSSSSLNVKFEEQPPKYMTHSDSSSSQNNDKPKSLAPSISSGGSSSQLAPPRPQSVAVKGPLGRPLPHLGPQRKASIQRLDTMRAKQIFIANMDHGTPEEL